MPKLEVAGSLGTCSIRLVRVASGLFSSASRQSSGVPASASRLLERLKSVATTQSAITLSCRRDFPAHYMWPKLGFVSIGEKPGRSVAGHLLNLWHLTLSPANQMDLGLFQAQTSDETVDVIIDAQVFFDLFKPDTEESEQSRALLSDFLVDSLNLRTTDELLNEIDRNEDPDLRRAGRARMQQFPQVHYSPHLVDDFEGRLRSILPHRTPSQVSDIKHLAKAAASDVGVFVTRDRPLLNKARDIADLTNLRVLSPTELIIELHELIEGQSYGPDRVSGLGLGWYRCTVRDLASLAVDSFLNEGEGLRRLRLILDRYLTRPTDYQCELLKAENKDVAIRILSTTSNGHSHCTLSQGGPYCRPTTVRALRCRGHHRQGGRKEPGHGQVRVVRA